jgi:nitrogen-specific signal transduction histidine kinase
MPVDFIEKETTRCKNIVANLLSFARTSKSETRTPTDIAKLIEETATLVLSQARVKNVDLKKELSEKLPTVAVNKTQIQQVILNLCNNAIDAMPNGGTLTITTSLSKDKRSYQIEITDTGCGIAPEDLKQIFEPFFTKKDKGTGLGFHEDLLIDINTGEVAYNNETAPAIQTSYRKHKNKNNIATVTDPRNAMKSEDPTGLRPANKKNGAVR